MIATEIFGAERVLTSHRTSGKMGEASLWRNDDLALGAEYTLAKVFIFVIKEEALVKKTDVAHDCHIQ